MILLYIFFLFFENSICSMTFSSETDSVGSSMNIKQVEFSLSAKKKGCHLVTDEIEKHLPPLPKVGILNLFIKHTSAALTINENCDPDVQKDLNDVFDHLVREREPYYRHTAEGDDDMPAHAKSTLSGVSLVIPIKDRRLNLGTWQGVYLCEFRKYGGPRSICATIVGQD